MSLQQDNECPTWMWAGALRLLAENWGHWEGRMGMDWGVRKQRGFVSAN